MWPNLSGGQLRFCSIPLFGLGTLLPQFLSGVQPAALSANSAPGRCDIPFWGSWPLFITEISTQSVCLALASEHGACNNTWEDPHEPDGICRPFRIRVDIRRHSACIATCFITSTSNSVGLTLVCTTVSENGLPIPVPSLLKLVDLAFVGHARMMTPVRTSVNQTRCQHQLAGT